MKTKVESKEFTNETFSTKKNFFINKKSISKRIKINFNKKCLLIFIIFIILSIIIIFNFSKFFKNYNITKLNSHYLKYNFFNDKNFSYEFKYDDIFTSFNKAKNFLSENINGKLINKKNFVLSENPKVSSVIPVYNCENKIIKAVRSIQNQNIDDIEIILVNDFSTENTVFYIEELQKEDPRIKIINNKKNMGILYSRSIGALYAKGKYIFPLDNDDMFLDYDVFNTIINVAEEENFDIVEFKGIKIIPNETDLLNGRIYNPHFIPKKTNIVLFQPELGSYQLKPFKKERKFLFYDNYLWNKCIKTDIYKKGLNNLGKERYERYMILHEDFMVLYILYNTARSFKYVGKYGILHYGIPTSASSTPTPKEKEILYDLYIIDAFLDFSHNSFKSKKYIVNYLIFLFTFLEIKETLKDNSNLNLLISILKRIYSSKYISKKAKDRLTNKLSKVSFLNINELDLSLKKIY